MDDELMEEKLDNPLVVHKENDASYQEIASEVSMSNTHTDEESEIPTLERHRFRKEKKKKKWPWIFIIIVAAAVVVLVVLHNKGYIDSTPKTTESTTRKSYTTQEENKFEGIITVKGTYIFFEGEEVDGIRGLERKIKYLDAGTSFVVQDEKADSNFLNDDVLPILEKYDIKYTTKYIVSSGLIAENEKNSQSTQAASSETAQK